MIFEISLLFGHDFQPIFENYTHWLLSAIDEKKITAVVFLDMSKAFDTINHGILLNKLLDIGISLSIVAWFTSYLSDRRQVVRINSTFKLCSPDY